MWLSLWVFSRPLNLGYLVILVMGFALGCGFGAFFIIPFLWLVGILPCVVLFDSY